MKKAYIHIGCKDGIGQERKTFARNAQGKQITASFDDYFKFIKWCQSLPHGLYWKAKYDCILPGE